MYVRAFLLLQKDLIKIFDYVEPCNSNRYCYSHRIHEVLVRAAIEVEVNFKAILSENDYGFRKDKNGDTIRWNMGDYRKINKTHRLSSYRVEVPYWRGDSQKRPFAAWSGKGVPEWYDAYNATKHNRHDDFKKSTLDNAVYAVSALAVLMAAQFGTEDFTPGPQYISTGGTYERDESAFLPGIGGFFSIQSPHDWPHEEMYDFTLQEWLEMEKENDPFCNLRF
ncbi:MAG: hypothetical protein AAGC69_07980 [Paracraurococcus sp.]